MPPPRWRRWLKRIALSLLAFVLLLGIAIFARCVYAFRDRNPGYELGIAFTGAESRAHPKQLRVGFARVNINPDIANPNKPVYIAGFGQNRKATAIHDDLWAVAFAIDDGYTRAAVVVLDAIGFFHDDVIEVRRRIASDFRLNYTIVCSTHNHSTPDLLGLWGPDILHTGVDPDYRERVIAGAASAIGQAVNALQPAEMALHEIPLKPDGLVADTRKPLVYDSDLRVMHFTRPGAGDTIGTIVGWGNHPETVWSQNTEITADFPGYLRDALEHGVSDGSKVHAAGLKGIHMFVNGAVGGLMTTHPSVTVTNPLDRVLFSKPTHDKTRALGNTLALRVLERIASAKATPSPHAPMSVRAKTIEVPLDNKAFLLAPVLGLIDRGHVRWKRFRTEVAVLTIGDASIACIPGEIYPEIVNGGIERAPGGDYSVDPVEVPSIRELMPGKVKFIFGLANDEIGYIIPKSEWDRKPPYIYGSERKVYGEINSVGPDVAGVIHKAIAEFCRQLR